MFQKVLLSTDSSERNWLIYNECTHHLLMIHTKQMHNNEMWDSCVRDECRCERESRCIKSICFKKLSSESRTNCWKLYKVCTDVVRSLNALSICVSRTSAQLSEIDVKESSDANWMSVKLKKKSQ
jgi:hypothetical protein